MYMMYPAQSMYICYFYLAQVDSEVTYNMSKYIYHEHDKSAGFARGYYHDYQELLKDM